MDEDGAQRPQPTPCRAAGGIGAIDASLRAAAQPGARTAERRDSRVGLPLSPFRISPDREPAEQARRMEAEADQSQVRAAADEAGKPTGATAPAAVSFEAGGAGGKPGQQ